MGPLTHQSPAGLFSSPIQEGGGGGYTFLDPGHPGSKLNSAVVSGARGNPVGQHCHKRWTGRTLARILLIQQWQQIKMG